MICPKCGAAIKVSLNIQMVIPGDMVGKITKRGLARKECEIWGASWDRATYGCTKCDWIDKPSYSDKSPSPCRHTLEDGADTTTELVSGKSSGLIGGMQ